MKKLIAIALLLSFTAIGFTSCTDENIAPAKEPSNNQGGSPIKE